MKNLFITPKDSLSALLASTHPSREEPVAIHLAPGTYYEKLVINKPFLHLSGECAEKTILALDDYANLASPRSLVGQAIALYADGDNLTFKDCRITGASCPAGSVYLARPWRNYARTVFLRCSMDSCIHPAGFHDWNKPEAQSSVLYGEYENKGEGASTKNRASFAHLLTEKEAARYSLPYVFSSVSPSSSGSFSSGI